MKFTKVYRAKSLINGGRIHQDTKVQFVAVPDRDYKGLIIRVEYMGQAMIIKNWRKEALMFRRFPDLYRRGESYTLGYFEWKPTEKANYQMKVQFVGNRAILE